MHTPGPWAVDPIWQTLDVYAPDKHGHAAAVRVAECGRTLLPAAEIRANAALVAAAPDLLAALQHMVDMYQRHFDVMPVAWQTADDIARAAIARATGGQ